MIRACACRRHPFVLTIGPGVPPGTHRGLWRCSIGMRILPDARLSVLSGAYAFAAASAEPMSTRTPGPIVGARVSVRM
jgi:hypothetical protein